MAEGGTRGCELNSEANLRVNIVVPSISPTDNTTSNIIKVEYSIRVREFSSSIYSIPKKNQNIRINYFSLKVIGSVMGCHSNPTIYLPIIIGSVPILDNPPVVPMNSYPEMSVPTAPMPTDGITSERPTAPLLDNGGNPNNVPYPNEPSPSAPYPSDRKQEIQFVLFESNWKINFSHFQNRQHTRMLLNLETRKMFSNQNIRCSDVKHLTQIDCEKFFSKKKRC